MAKRSEHMVSAYMHTINGRPAQFVDEQIVYMAHGRPMRLAWSLSRAREEQVLSVAFRSSKGFSIFNYEYVRVLVPASWKPTPPARKRGRGKG